jgi:hypothetical protein
LSGKKKDGEEADVWFRTTFACEKWGILGCYLCPALYPDLDLASDPTSFSSRSSLVLLLEADGSVS